MNAESRISVPQQDGAASPLATCFTRLSSLVTDFKAIRTALGKLERTGATGIQPSIDRIRGKLDAFEPTVTMIGQIKAGKTTLVNAMVGWPDLLPADINPWTSVVTSLHLDPRLDRSQQRAEFQFFSQKEWDRLVVGGGRLGQLAGRANAESEVEKVRRQIAEMREKSMRRLGRKFELLLGQSHDYGHLDEELVERYVCLGDDFEDDTETSNARGRFADITKAARLYVSRPELPVPLCIRDTPGMNDTFMVREQITIRAIRDSRMCVVVLSAHQALSAVDMALIRMINNVKAREVIIFVNRIDELHDPAAQVPEIRDSIRATLRAQGGPETAEIVFGSAMWAKQAFHKGLGEVSDEEAAVLQGWAEASGLTGDPDNPDMLWRLSGVPALYAAIADRIAEGEGSDLVASTAREVSNLANGLKASMTGASLRSGDPARSETSVAEAAAALKSLSEVCETQIRDGFATLLMDFDARIARAHQSFLQRATAALIEHLERWGEKTAWKYDPTGLRVLLRSAYQQYVKRGNDAGRSVFDKAAKDITQLYWQCKLVDDSSFKIEPPVPPRAPAPVLLGQTIALDLQTNWWSRWWRRQRGYEAYAREFHDLIHAETEPILQDLMTDHALAVRTEMLKVMAEFLSEQSRLLLTALGQPGTGGPQPPTDPARRKARLNGVIDDLQPLRSNGAQ